MHVFEDLNARNLVYTITDEALATKLNTESMTFYLGADPTSDSLHVGHLLTLVTAKRLVNAGHKAILLIGGGTGLIGDPSGKNEERKLLELKDVQHNSNALAKQVQTIVPEADVVNNYDWLKRYDMITFLRDIGKHFGINAMLAKDSVKSRLEAGISFTEFSYQIIQALDFAELYKTKECTLQIGGQDQWGNITAGLELIRRMHGSESEAYGLVMPLIVKEDGTKFGKSEAGAVWLDKAKTSPYAFYQYWINLSDKEALERLKQFSLISLEAIEAITRDMQSTPHLRHAQKQLAEELTAMVHGDAARAQVVRITEALFNSDIHTLSAEDIAMGLEDVPSAKAETSMSLIDALLELKLAQSRREARTFLKNNAIEVNGTKQHDEQHLLSKDNALHEKYHVIKRGKKRYGLLTM